MEEIIYGVRGTDDTITSGSDLKLVYEFIDGDTRITTLPNPRLNLTQNDLDTAMNELVTSQVFVGDKDGGAFDKFADNEVIQWTKTKLDLS